MLRNISTSNIFPNRLLGKRFHQHHHSVLAAVSMNGLKVLELNRETGSLSTGGMVAIQLCNILKRLFLVSLSFFLL